MKYRISGSVIAAKAWRISASGLRALLLRTLHASLHALPNAKYHLVKLAKISSASEGEWRAKEEKWRSAS